MGPNHPHKKRRKERRETEAQIKEPIEELAAGLSLVSFFCSHSRRSEEPWASFSFWVPALWNYNPLDHSLGPAGAIENIRNDKPLVSSLRKAACLYHLYWGPHEATEAFRLVGAEALLYRLYVGPGVSLACKRLWSLAGSDSPVPIPPAPHCGSTHAVCTLPICFPSGSGFGGE